MVKTAPRRTIIIGAGLSGLAAAFRLTQLGHNVTVFERRSGLSTTGGTIMVRSNVSKIVKAWGLGPDIEAISDVSSSGIYRRAEDGEVLHERVPAKYTEHPDWGTFRDKLLKVFYENAITNHAEVRFGISVSRVWEDEYKSFVLLDSGETMEADLVLATDGGLSRIRQCVLGEDLQVQIRVAPMTFHQVTVSRKELLEHPFTKHLTENSNLTVWFRQGSYAVGRYSPKLDRFGGIFAVPADEEENPKLWEESGNIEHVREVFSNYEEPIRQILSTARSCDRWRLTEMPDLPTWSSTHGRLVLLGDSAHAMLPDAAQGFSQTIEDIEVLTLLLEQYSDLKYVSEIWEEVRLPRVARIKEFALNAKKAASNTNKAAEDQPAAVVPDRNAEFNSPAFNAWVYAYDAGEEIAQVIAGQ
ncbi:hypothetical protein M409DRAFT_61977 [Zasmidium cellare ATCC 36951]|uniref:FAD-binding domain-containing protein n=1 Tax=Zasmidium cellare ATCC 36951 TaxID=1080233 RepID=A0A6A6D5L3_ZASCE|nr:uncharacterized protein M409DRAFT_61977 [Zasmidium cellare ATCC 36951]KAF2173660.1 hypothetical protein M409DRAFT_61977 [Zasmidium cellare ATCC 36951]